MQLNSESVLKGAERAPNRSLFYALGYTDEEINRPLIGVVSARTARSYPAMLIWTSWPRLSRRACAWRAVLLS